MVKFANRNGEQICCIRTRVKNFLHGTPNDLDSETSRVQADCGEVPTVAYLYN
jgi:hypothetical protein